MRGGDLFVLMIAALATSSCPSAREERRAAPAVQPEADALRTPQRVRAEGNHLVGSGSAYLRQHAHNPVDWYPWGREAIDRAVRLDRPIFVSIGYVACHWCHVMEADVFEHDDVAAFLNDNFVSIKVDREERPDLDAAYMEAVQAMTGSGGWPLTAFLTPSLHPFFGGTYFPHDRFMELAVEIAAKFRTARGDVESRGAEVFRSVSARMTPSEAPGLEIAGIRSAVHRALASVDATWGGFGGRTKFPTPVRWGLLLHAYRKWSDPDVATALRRTLDAMAAGGIHDQVGGGFFRYATEPTWTVPHFEKMLYDNAQLAELYLEAAAAFGEPRYRAVATDTLAFLLGDMRNGQGAFGASFDADCNGREGAAYLFTPAELRAVAGDADGRALAALLGVTEAGNFQGSNVPTMRSVAPDRGGAAMSWNRWRPALLEARRRRPQPAFDPKTVTAWNGLAIHALALGYRASGEERFLVAAREAAEAVEAHNHRPSGELARASNEGLPGEGAVLDDYAFFARALVDLFEATSEPAYLDRAVALTKEAMVRFENPAGAWFLTSGPDQEPLGRHVDLHDSVEPSGNAVLIQTLERLAALTGREELREAADRALRAYGATALGQGLDMAGWLDGALMAAGPFYEVVIAGAEADPRTAALKAAWGHLLAPWVVGAQVPGEGSSADLERAMPPATGKRDRKGTPLAYVCVRGSCKQPTSSPDLLRAELLAGWAH